MGTITGRHMESPSRSQIITPSAANLASPASATTRSYRYAVAQALLAGFASLVRTVPRKRLYQNCRTQGYGQIVVRPSAPTRTPCAGRGCEGLHSPICNESGDILRTSIMVYLKSFLVGVAALVLVLFLSIVGFIVWGLWISPRPSNQGSVGTVSYDVSSPWIGIPLLIVVALIFLAGFSWEFRRATRAKRPLR